MQSSLVSSWRIAAAVAAVAAALLGAIPASAAGPSASVQPTWSAIGRGNPPTVTAAAVSGDRLYVAGNISGLARASGPLSVVDPASGDLVPGPLLTRPSAAADWIVTAIAADRQGGYYVAGSFGGAEDGAAQIARANLIRFTAGGVVDTRFNPSIPLGGSERIDALAVAIDGTLYVGGSFTRVGGQSRSGLVALNGVTGGLRTAFNAQTNEPVRAIELNDAAATAYIAGEFTQVRGTPREGAAEVRLADGTLTAWDPKVRGAATAGQTLALELSGSTVYIGGSFAPPSGSPGDPTVGNAPRSRLAAVDAVTGAVKAWAPDPDERVFDIAVVGSTVFVGGAFSRIGTQSTQPILRGAAAVDAASGAADPTWDPGIPAGPAVGQIVPAGDTVYLSSGPDEGERFTQVQGVPRCTAAAVDAPDGTAPAVKAWNPHPVLSARDACNSLTKVFAMEAIGGRVLIGGSQQFANLRPRQGLAAIDLATGEPLPWAPATNGGVAGTYGDVRDMKVSADGQTVYLAGRFTQVNLQAVARLAAVDANGAANVAAAVRSGWAAPDNEVRAIELSADGGTLYLGGGFAKVGGVNRSRLAAVRTDTGALDPLTFKAPSASVWDLERSPEGTLFATGAFVTVGAPAATRNHVAEYDPATGDLLPWDAGLPATAEVEDVAFSGAVVYVAGSFDGTVGGAPRTHVAALRRADATATDWDPRPDARIRRVSVAPDGTVHLTGPFTELGGVAQAGGASVDPGGGAITNWRPDGLIVPYDANRSTPEVLFGDGERVLLGGGFTSVSGRPQGGFAVFGPATAPGAIGPPAIVGTPDIGTALTCAPGTWSGSAPFVRELSWLRAGEPIPGADTDRYVVGEEDSGVALSCRERVANMAGEAVQTSADVVASLNPPAVEVAPVVAGEPYAGRDAVCSTGLWLNRPSEFSYQWLLDGALVDGATDRGFHVGADARGRMLGCEVVARNAAGAGAPARSQAVRVTQAPPRSLVAPRVLGGETTGTELTCDPGNWEEAASFTFQWLRDGADIAGATAARYRAITADAAHVVACRVTGHNDDHRTVAESPPLLIRGGVSAQQRARRSAPEEADEDVPPKRLDVRRVRLRGGRLQVTLRAPSAGRLALRATMDGKGKPRAIGRAGATTKRAATVTVRLRLSSSARRAMRRAGTRGVRVTLRAELDPVTGKKLTDTARVKVKEPR